MNKIIGFLLMVIMLAICPTTSVQANELFVSKDGSETYISIQEAINASQDGDIVSVKSGIYKEKVSLINKNIVLRSIDGPQTTIIDGGHDYIVLFIEGGAPEISGLTLRNGRYTYGGGLYIMYSYAKIKDMIISKNFAYKGAGVFIIGGGVLIQDSQIINNSILLNTPNDTPNDGAGLFITDSDTVMINNLIAYNINDLGCTAIKTSNRDRSHIMNNNIMYNHYVGSTNTTGYAVCLGNNTKNIFENNIVYYNYTGSNTPVSLLIDSTSVSAVTHNNIQGSGFFTNGNIDTDPEVEANGVHLISSSPLIDAGTPINQALIQTDIDGESRINGGAIDIGMDEFVVNNNGSVSGFIVCSCNQKGSTLSLFDQKGQLVNRSTGVNTKHSKYHFEGLGDGIYTLEISNPTGQKIFSKIFKIDQRGNPWLSDIIINIEITKEPR